MEALSGELPTTIVPPAAGSEPVQQRARMMGAAVGGVAGFFGGFFLGFAGFAYFFFQDDFPPDRLFWLMPLMVFGGAVVLAAVGVGVGAAAQRRFQSLVERPARQLSSEEKQALERRRRIGTIGGFAGAIVGFFVGAFLPIAICEALGAPFNNGPAMFALFFAGMGIGLASGALIGGRVALAVFAPRDSSWD
jgi:MFS family permease